MPSIPLNIITRILLSALAVLATHANVAAQDKHAAEFKRIDLRIDAWQPTKDERRFDDIAWVEDIRTALKLGKETNRPVFLFTHKGRMNIGRC